MQKSVLLLLGALVALLPPTTGIRVVREVTLTAWPRRRARQPRTTKSTSRITAVSTLCEGYKAVAERRTRAARRFRVL